MSLVNLILSLFNQKRHIDFCIASFLCKKIIDTFGKDDIFFNVVSSLSQLS